MVSGLMVPQVVTLEALLVKLFSTVSLLLPVVYSVTSVVAVTVFMMPVHVSPLYCSRFVSISSNVFFSLRGIYTPIAAPFTPLPSVHPKIFWKLYISQVV